MAYYLEKVRPDAANGYSRLFLDFAAQPSKGLPPYLSGVGAGRGFWLDAVARADAARKAGDAETWRILVDDIFSLSERLGARPEVLDKVRAAARGEACFVVAGQQPGVFGGPLVTAYKVFTAIALARRIEEITSRAVVPLYWCGADDIDFREIRTVSLLTKDSTPISASIAQQALAAGFPIGSIATEWLSGLWTNLKGFVGEFEQGSFVTHLIEEAFAKVADHGEHASALLVALTDGALAVIDGRSPAMRRHSRRVIAGYIADEDAIKREIIDRGKRLERSGYHAQLAVGEDSGVFLFENGVRKNVTPDLRAALADAAANAVERCSPGVIARNLVQDGGIAPVAVVLGPAEIAYRCQMSSLYGRFGIPSPVPVPRLMATFLPPALAGMLEGAPPSAVESLLADPAEFARLVFERSADDKLRRSAAELEKDVAGAVDRFSRALDDAAPPKTLSRVKARLGDLKSRAALAAGSVSEIGKAAALDRWSFLSDLGAVVKPAGKPQERTLSSLVPFMFGGEGMRQDLLAVASSYVDDLLDGRTQHIVYSSVK